jgi:hypothetical protein
MVHARLLVWLIAVVALLAPPGLTVQATMAAGHVATVDCPHHAPPPDPCPERGKAKHAAGVCCPLMSGAVALLPATVANAAVASSHALQSVRLPSLIGRLFTQDPPPPRV